MRRLAELIGVEPRSVSAYEKREFSPDTDKLQEISKVLRFPTSFFFGDDLKEPSPQSASFRALSRMTASQRGMAHGAGAIALLLNEWIEERFELPAVNLTDLSRGERDPEAAAAAIRQQWALGELPVKNMVHLLESKGVRVFSLSMDAVEVDAFSMWYDDKPFVFLNTLKSAEHGRFDAAHELAHLVLHRHGGPQGQEAEREAHAFAAAFLMPRASVLARPPRFATTDSLVKLKKDWIVSVAALAYRLHTVGILSEWHYRQLYIDMSSRGYRTSEPEGAPRETSQLLEKVFAALREEGVSKKEVAEQLHIFPEEIEQLVFGLTVTGLPTALGPPSLTARRAQLRLVKSSGPRRRPRP